ncbi:MAG: lipid II flippase MurJ [Candidatus Paceibacterota bacterium]|jgi:putative peptidoglycan lipid II flippase
MVRRTLNAITSKISGLHEAAFWLAGFSILSQILAFIRDRILAYHFGAGHELDIYYASFEIPDLIFATAASLVSASILIPFFVKQEQNSEEHLKKYINSVFTSFFLFISVCAVLAWVFMPMLVPLFFKNLGPEAVEKIINFSRILLLSPFFLGLSNFFGSIVQYEKRFLLYSLSPLLYNFGIILGAFFGASQFGVAAVVTGVAVGAFLHMLVQMIWVYRSGNGPKFIKDLDLLEVKKTFALSIPRTLSLSASSLVGLFFVVIASKFPTGSIAVFTFSFNLQSIPLVIIGASYSLAAFPTLAGHYVKGELLEIGACLSSGLRHIIFWSLPVAALFIVLRAHVVRVILGSGSFDWSDTKMTAAALALFVFSVVFQSIQLFLTRAHYAFGKTRLPLFINLGNALLTVSLAMIFAKYFAPNGLFFTFVANILKVEGLERVSVLSLPIAFSIGAFISATLLWLFLEKEIRKSATAMLVVSFRDSILNAFCIGFVTSISLHLLDGLFDLDATLEVFAHAFISGIIGIAAGILLLLLIKNKEMAEIIAKFKKPHEQN